MKKAKWKTYLFWIALCEAVGAVAGLLSRNGIETYGETTAIPIPAAVFPVVWTVLYALMGIGMARVRLYGGGAAGRAQNWFVAQMIVNFFWPLIFFNARAFGLAFAWLLLLWVLALGMAMAFSRQDRIAGWLQVPYLAWLMLAAYLNFYVWQMN